MRDLMISAVATLLGLAAASGVAQALEPVGTAFTYQGQLKESGVPANGEYDFVFALFDDSAGGAQIGGYVLVDDWPVANGLFTVEIDFGADVFTGNALWLGVAVRPGASSGDHTILEPRQPLNAAPYALYALGGPGGAGGYWAANGPDIHNTNAGNVGIGTTTPTASLHVANDGGEEAIRVVSPETPLVAHRNSTTGSSSAAAAFCDSVDPYASGFWGVITSTSPGPGSAGVRGQNNGTNDAGAGVVGSHDGSGVGVHGTAPNGTAVLGAADGTSGTNYGVRGRSWSPEGYGVQGDCSLGTGVFGIGGATSGVNYGVHGKTNSPDGYAGYFTGGRNYFEGNVGINFETPHFPLTIGVDDHGHALWTNGQVHLDRAGTALKIRHETAEITKAAEFDGNHINSSGSPFTPALELNSASSGDVLLARGGGNVGIGTDQPVARLHISGGADAEPGSGGYVVVGGTSAFSIALDNNEIMARFLGSPATLRLNNDGGDVLVSPEGTGNVGIGTATPQARLDVAGDVIVRSALHITGGADLSERFEVSGPRDKPVPGSVVSIDPERPGDLVVSTHAYDRAVAGVISGAGGVKPGMLMGQAGSIADGEYPVALTGRVWCRCETSAGPIRPGDLLTTSNVPGHAMRVTEHSQAHGATLGKAMTSLDSGCGLVLVLVSLQ